jgi:hypothetical protein
MSKKGLFKKLFLAGLITASTIYDFSKATAQSSKIDSYFKKLNSFNFNNSKIPNYFLSSSKLVGKYYDEYNAYHTFATSNPAFIRFGNALYNGNSDYTCKRKQIITNKMIPFEDKLKADSISKELYFDFCKRNDLDPDHTINFSQSPYLFTDSIEGEWVGIVYVGNKNYYRFQNFFENKYYTPKLIIALHELGHLERWSGTGKEYYEYKGDPKIATLETATRIDEVINRDYIYKQIHNIPIDSLVTYDEKLPCNTCEGIDLGIIANTFRKLKTQYSTVEECLMSKEGQEFVIKYYFNTK